MKALAVAFLVLAAGEPHMPLILSPPAWVPAGNPEQEEAEHFACVAKHPANSEGYWQCIAELRRGTGKTGGTDR